ncbi:Imm70 family immunity protein [Singulisphaera rosea]
MGLTLCVFISDPNEEDEAEEIAECSVGHYSDFACFRETIARHLDSSRFPTLLEHSDCDGEWTLAEIPMLEREILEIGSAFQGLPPEEPAGAFEHTV